VSRPGKWGNPFVVGQHGSRAECVSRFIDLSLGFINISVGADVEAQRTLYRRIQRSIGDLAGRDLACWCDGNGPCHADVLLVLANKRPLTDLNAYTVEQRRISIGLAAADLDKADRAKRRKERLAA
jgi:hypothetical protein